MTAKHSRSKTGCITCRIRRIKCDEEKPSCRRCVSTGRKCDGYVVQSRRQPQHSMSIIVLGTSTNTESCAASSGCAVRARISFEMFKDIYAPALSGYGTPGFWQRVVLQASDMSQAIKHLILAASSLYWEPELHSAQVQVTGRRSVPFLAHYGRALRLLGRCASADVVVVLVACVLLAVCDDLQQDSSGAQRHIHAGQRILLSQSNASQLYRWEHTTTLDEIASTFSCLCAPRPASARLQGIKNGVL